ncbi:MAG: thioesterase family protein [Pseudomonadota bacterium]
MHLFDTDIHGLLARRGPDCFSVVISPAWSINTVPNGGYLMALAAAAVMEMTDKRALPIMTVNYLARSIPGDAEIRVEPMVRAGSFERYRVNLSQAGEVKFMAFATLASADSGTASRDHRYYEEPPPDLPDPGVCNAMPPMPGYTLYENMDVRIDPAFSGWMTGGSMATRSEHRGWIRFREPRPLDTLGVLLMADAFPPPIFATQGMVSWVPTLEFSVNIRNITVSSWVKAVFRTRFVNRGMLEEDGQLWDEAGELVAVSRQIAQYRRISS